MASSVSLLDEEDECRLLDRTALALLRRCPWEDVDRVECTFGGEYNRKDKELEPTLIEDKAMASAATVGGNRVCKNG